MTQSAYAISEVSNSTAFPKAKERLIAVVPAFNEEKNVSLVIAELKKLELDGLQIGFVIVDDGSKDRTRQVARAEGAPVVSLPYNMGIGIAVQTGFRFALDQGADYVVQIDGDCQHIPSEISKLMAPIRQGSADVVIGSRFSSRESRASGLETTTFLRWLVGRVLSLNIRLLTGMQVTDTTSGFRLFNRKAAQFVAESYPDDYPEVQILVPLACHGFKVREVPVQMRPRQNGHSSINWYRSIYYVIKVILSTGFDRLRGSL